MSEELKPCPFCGGEASHNGGGGSVLGRFWWTVGCKARDVWFADPEVWSGTDHGMLDPAYPPKHCFAAWNTRADLADAQWNAAIQKAAFIAHSGVEAYGAKMRGATDKKEKRDWQSMLMAAVDIEHAILALLKEEPK